MFRLICCPNSTGLNCRVPRMTWRELSLTLYLVTYPNFRLSAPARILCTVHLASLAAHGKSIGGGDAQAMLDEVDGPMNFTQMVTLFATKMAGGSDDDDVILASFEAFEQDGKID